MQCTICRLQQTNNNLNTQMVNQTLNKQSKSPKIGALINDQESRQLFELGIIRKHAI